MAKLNRSLPLRLNPKTLQRKPEEVLSDYTALCQTIGINRVAYLTQEQAHLQRFATLAQEYEAVRPQEPSVGSKATSTPPEVKKPTEGNVVPPKATL